MGAANKVPGVSGGIIAYVGGFYEEFIYSLQQFNGKAASAANQSTKIAFFEDKEAAISMTSDSVCTKNRA